MRFRLVLWGLGFLLKRAAKNNPKLQEKIKHKQIVFQVQTQDGGVVRHYQINGMQIHSKGEVHREPAFCIVFDRADTGYRVLTSQDKNAFMRSIQDKHTQVQGDLSELLWFQGIVKYLKF